MSTSKKPVKSKAPRATPKSNKPTTILFGLDEDERPRGAQFVGEDEFLLTRMAKVLGLRMGTPLTGHQLAVTNKLPKGDVHATGLKVVPQIGQDLYEQINALVGGETGVIATTQPKSWDEIEPGHLVIAQDSIAEGWWPAIVLKRHENSLVLKWRDFAGLREFIRDANSVALLRTD
jgi:hypothetical protein